MSLFGYFVDDEATSKAIPFLRSLIHLATTDDMSLRLFIVDDLLPSIVRRLDNQLTCAIQCQRHKLNPGAADSAGKDLVVLCQQLYNYFQIQASHSYFFCSWIEYYYFELRRSDMLSALSPVLCGRSFLEKAKTIVALNAALASGLKSWRKILN